VVGAGIFTLTGVAASTSTGPGLVISFVLAAIGCSLAGLCYSEFATMIPVAGSAYTYAYATFGELWAWIIGWDLILEYSVGAATVAIGWSQTLKALLASLGIGPAGEHFGVAIPERCGRADQSACGAHHRAGLADPDPRHS